MAQDARPPQPKPDCCEHDGILWDLAAVYPKAARWDATLPTAIEFDSPVVGSRRRSRPLLTTDLIIRPDLAS
jgi:hypothetical protein